MSDLAHFRIGSEGADRELEVRLKVNEKTGVTTVEEYYREHRLHRDGAPAYIVRDPVTGIVTREYWHRDGRQHREDGPAIIWRDARSGAVTDELWFIDGRKSMDDAAERPTSDAQSGFQAMSRHAT